MTSLHNVRQKDLNRTHTQRDINTHTHTRIYTYMKTHVNTFMHRHIFIYTQIPTNTNKQTHTHTHTHKRYVQRLDTDSSQLYQIISIYASYRT